jgi:hypothetical protein
MTDFPLDQWFDLSRRIGREERHECEAEMALRAYKDGLAADGPEVRQHLHRLRGAVRTHNKKFDAAGA